MLEKKQKTIGDCIYEQLLEDIIYLRFSPGEKLSEVQLADRYKVSRAPVRNALSKLQREGMVSIKPQVGTIVSEISAQKGRDICEMRLLLESYAVRIAAQEIGDEQLAKLQEAFDWLDAKDVSREERSRYVSQVDIQLHSIIFEVCGNLVIPQIIEYYHPEIQRIRRANSSWGNRTEPSLREMRKIFEALKRRDPDAAVAAMQEHICNIKAALGRLSLTKKGE